MNSGDHKPADRLERALAASLRPVDPGADFTAALQARLAMAAVHGEVAPVDPPGQNGHRSAFRKGPRWLYSGALALAASSVVALAVGWQLRDLQGLQRAELVRVEQTRVRTQLLLALEITSERLGRAQQRIEQYQSLEKSL